MTLVIKDNAAQAASLPETDQTVTTVFLAAKAESFAWETLHGSPRVLHLLRTVWPKLAALFRHFTLPIQ